MLRELCIHSTNLNTLSQWDTEEAVCRVRRMRALLWVGFLFQQRLKGSELQGTALHKHAHIRHGESKQASWQQEMHAPDIAMRSTPGHGSRRRPGTQARTRHSNEEYAWARQQAPSADLRHDGRVQLGQVLGQPGRWAAAGLGDAAPGAAAVCAVIAVTAAASDAVQFLVDVTLRWQHARFGPHRPVRMHSVPRSVLRRAGGSTAGSGTTTWLRRCTCAQLVPGRGRRHPAAAAAVIREPACPPCHVLGCCTAGMWAAASTTCTLPCVHLRVCGSAQAT